MKTIIRPLLRLLYRSKPILNKDAINKPRLDDSPIKVRGGLFIQYGSFLLALLLHFLLFSGLTYNGFFSTIPLKHELPELNIPAYVVHKQENTPSVETSPIHQKDKQVSDNGIEKPSLPPKKVLPALSQMTPVNIEKSTEEPVHLIGDKKVSKSLIVLLGKAITAHLIYPKTALDLNVRGTSYIGFMLYPDGHISDIKLLKNSTAEVLDQAALNAIKAIVPVQHVADYITKPEFIVFGIIFG